MCPVTITPTDGSPHTWASFPGSWEDTIKTWETAYPVTYDVDAAEALALAEGLAQQFAGAIQDAFLVGDTVRFSVQLVAKTTLTLAETYIDFIGWINAVSESLSIGEAPAKLMTRPVAEVVAVLTSRLSEIVNDAPETLTVVESLLRAYSAIRNADEALAVTDHRLSVFLAEHPELFAVMERLIRRANGVLYDLLVRDTALTEAEMRELAEKLSPVGYEDFKPFFPGDYDYAKALFGFVVGAEVTFPGRPLISTLQVNVDVPDIREVGSASVPIGGLHISFTKDFHAAPELAVGIKAGTTAGLAEFSNLTVEGFDLILYNDFNRTASVAGDVSWTALGN